MERHAFESPVWIYVGLHFPRAVGTVGEALMILSDWPHHKRASEHRLALQACKAALGGTLDAETVRAAFAAFAKKGGILAPEVEPALAAKPKPLDARAAF